MTLVRPLDSASTYTFCPVCRDNGNPESPVTRDSVGAISCRFGHKPEIILAEGPKAGLLPMEADTIKLVDFQPEEPGPMDLKWPIPIHPELRAKIEEKYKGRVFKTITVLLSALADGSLVMITGEQASRLRKLGIRSGVEMLAAMEMHKQVQKERDEIKAEYERLVDMLRKAGMQI